MWYHLFVILFILPCVLITDWWLLLLCWSNWSMPKYYVHYRGRYTFRGCFMPSQHHQDPESNAWVNSTSGYLVCNMLCDRLQFHSYFQRGLWASCKYRQGIFLFVCVYFIFLHEIQWLAVYNDYTAATVAATLEILPLDSGSAILPSLTWRCYVHVSYSRTATTLTSLIVLILCLKKLCHVCSSVYTGGMKYVSMPQFGGKVKLASFIICSRMYSLYYETKERTPRG